MSTPVPRPPRSRRWVWFFVALAALALLAPTILIVYNLRQQLQPEELAAARQRWKETGPRDYDLLYTVRRQGGEPEVYAVKVRGGKVIEVTLNDRPLGEARLLHYHSMPALFDHVEDYLEKDRQPGKPRTYLKATFDSGDGHLQHFVRSAGRERLEMRVRLTPAGQGGNGPAQPAGR